MVTMAAQHALSDGERARVRDAVAAAEAGTAGEIFVVVAEASDDYRFIPLLWATLAALAVPLPLILFTELAAATVFAAQLVAFIVLALALSWPAMRPQVVPGRVKHGRAHALAVQQFLAHGLQTTEARTGALIFVSLAERHAEVVADAGIAAKVGQAEWDAIIAGLVGEIRSRRLAEGLAAAVGHVGAVLAQHFPPKPGDRNELANDVVLL
jgi:putative membrane protein